MMQERQASTESSRKQGSGLFDSPLRTSRQHIPDDLNYLSVAGFRLLSSRTLRE